MSERPTPTPEVVELTRELARTQEKSRDTESTGCFGGVMVGLAVWLLPLLLAFPAGEAVRQISFAFGQTRTVEASVVQVGSGSSMVHFTTEEGIDVYAWLPQEYGDDDPRSLEVTYRVHDPREVLATDRPWSPTLLMFPVLLVAWVLFELFHRRGLRAGWFWRRVRTLAKGPSTRAKAPRTSYMRFSAPKRSGRPGRGPWTSAVVGTVLLLAGLVMVGTSFFHAPEGLLILAAAPLTFGVTLLRAALYRYADTTPVTALPRTFRLAPRGIVRWTAPVLFAGAVMVTIPTLPMDDRVLPPAPETEVLGSAEVVDDGCVHSDGGPCQAYVVIQYHAAGMWYLERLDVELLGLDDLLAQETVDIAWDREDPRRVRLVD